MKTNKLFLQDLKDAYENEFELTNGLDAKANNFLTISGLVATLLFGFGSLMVDKLDASYVMLMPVSILLMIGIVGNVMSIFWSVMALRLHTYWIAMSPFDFFNDPLNENDNSFNQKQVEKYRDGENEDEYIRRQVRDYLIANRANRLRTKEKGKKIKIAQWFFFGSIATVPIVIAIVLTHLPNPQ
jgi:hypothetical protein